MCQAAFSWKPFPVLHRDEKRDTDLEFRTLFLPLLLPPLPATQTLAVSLAFNFVQLSHILISHLSPFLWSWFIQRERMVSIIYSIPTHLWPWLMHRWPKWSLCQAAVEYSTVHAHACLHAHTKKRTGQWVQACARIYSRSLPVSAMDTWQQRSAATGLILEWLFLASGPFITCDDETALMCVVYIPVCLDWEQTVNPPRMLPKWFMVTNAAVYTKQQRPHEKESNAIRWVINVSIILYGDLRL